MLLKSTRLFARGVLLVAILAGPGHADAPAASEPGDSTRLDRSHRYLSGRVLRVAESINTAIAYTFRQAEDHESEMTRRFYGNLLTAYQVEGSHIRVTPRLIMTEGEDHDYKLDFSARLRLPDLSERLRLYVDSYDTDYDTMEEIFSARYRRQLETERSEGATAGLTYLVSDHMTRQLSLSTGLRFRPEPSPKLRLRGRLRTSFDLWRTDVAQSVFWTERDGFGEKTEFTLDRPAGEIHLFRREARVPVRQMVQEPTNTSPATKGASLQIEVPVRQIAAVLVVEIVGVLPDVAGQERGLPCASGVSALDVLTIFNTSPSCTSQTHPLPNWARAASLKAVLKASKLPNVAVIRSASLPVGAPPPLGFMLFQKNV
jgi:hypothetical protein